MNGIYCYTDLKTDEIVYIGKDSYIDKDKRYKDHLKPSNYKNQVFNRVLQNNPDRYPYGILYAGDFDEYMLNTLEINSIAEFKLSHNGKRPKFNFTDGGDGKLGYILSEETKQKISASRKDFRHSEESKQKITNSLKGRKHSEETKRKIGQAHAGKKISDETKQKLSESRRGENNPFYGKHHSDETIQKLKEYHTGKKVSDETRVKLSKLRNNTGYFRVSKSKSKKFKQGFVWRYRYSENGKQKSIESVDIKKLEANVKNKGLDWFKLEDK